MKYILYCSALIFYLFIFLTDPKSVSASVVYSSAQLIQNSKNEDIRSIILKDYLDKHSSPLANYADELISKADQYGLDWRLIPAISGVESTFGKNIPVNSYNAYGWANGKYAFSSWEDSINIVSSTLKEKYIDKGAVSLSQISRRYAPPSNSWAYKVRFFMQQINPTPLSFTL